MSQWLDICWLEVKQKEQPMNTYKEEQQNLTELNADGNRERGEEGEDLTVSNTVAALKGIPTKVDLKGLLEQNVIVVDFNKISGDKRVMTCTLREDMKPRATKDDTLSQKKVREMSDAVVNVWDVKAEGWRSFRYDRINSVDVVDEYMMGWYNEVRDGHKTLG